MQGGKHMTVSKLETDSVAVDLRLDVFTVDTVEPLSPEVVWPVMEFAGELATLEREKRKSEK